MIIMATAVCDCEFRLHHHRFVRQTKHRESVLTSHLQEAIMALESMYGLYP